MAVKKCTKEFTAVYNLHKLSTFIFIFVNYFYYIISEWLSRNVLRNSQLYIICINCQNLFLFFLIIFSILFQNGCQEMY